MSKKLPSRQNSNNQLMNSMQNLFNYLNTKVSTLNTSKVFAGLMIVILNISSKFVTIKLSKTMEGYLKYTFSRDILVFAICWVGSRDIYIAIILTCVFIFMIDYILNEESSLCCLSKGFTDYHISLVEGNTTITDEELKRARELIEKAEKQNEGLENNTTYNKISTTPSQGSLTARPTITSSSSTSSNKESNIY